MANEQEIQEHLITALRWIQTARAADGKAELSLRKMSSEAGLAETAAEQIVNRRQKTVNVTTVFKLAQRWNVRVFWMLTGQGPREPFEGNMAESIVADIVAELERRGMVGIPAKPLLVAKTATAPETWRGWDKAVREFFRSIEEDDLYEIGVAAIGLGKTPTTTDRPEQLDKLWISRNAESFLAAPRSVEWKAWRDEARELFDNVRFHATRGEKPIAKKRPDRDKGS